MNEWMMMFSFEKLGKPVVQVLWSRCSSRFWCLLIVLFSSIQAVIGLEVIHDPPTMWNSIYKCLWTRHCPTRPLAMIPGIFSLLQCWSSPNLINQGKPLIGIHSVELWWLGHWCFLLVSWQSRFLQSVQLFIRWWIHSFFHKWLWCVQRWSKYGRR